ncbi:MAG: hypothetical protein EOM59_13615 [Clostridia bacterium]|nr:hypothetical protein [Clostridia bacterium]
MKFNTKVYVVDTKSDFDIAMTSNADSIEFAYKCASALVYFGDQFLQNPATNAIDCDGKLGNVKGGAAVGIGSYGGLHGVSIVA